MGQSYQSVKIVRKADMVDSFSRKLEGLYGAGRQKADSVDVEIALGMVTKIQKPNYSAQEEIDLLFREYGIEPGVLSTILYTTGNKFDNAKKNRLRKDLDIFVKKHGDDALELLQPEHVTDKGKIRVEMLLAHARNRQ